VKVLDTDVCFENFGRFPDLPLEDWIRQPAPGSPDLGEAPQ
jgi:hypothetical protein